ncbi:hypothetical protein SNE40_004595 [Patella caerulea]|uniref:Uncharacterized protein n=1 Tax=Patella caerulea TaxID=87958 RepID=A0AAN8K391_PATCE
MATQCLLDNLETGELPDDAPAVYGCDGCSRLAKSSKRSPCGHSIFIFKSLLYNKVTREVCRACGIALGIGTFIIGLRYRNSCHFEPAIPIFLMVFGSVLALQTVFRTILLCRPKIKVVEGEAEGLDPLAMLIKIQTLFLVLWILAGSVWIYSAKGIVQFWQLEISNYCNVTVFWTSFGVVTSAYCSVFLVIIYFVLTYTVLKLNTDQKLRTASVSSIDSDESNSSDLTPVEFIVPKKV